MSTRRNSLVWLALLVLAIIVLREVLLAIMVYFRFPGVHPLAIYAISTSAVGIITFFGFLSFAHQEGGALALNESSIRLAIVAAIVTVELVLVGSVTFFTLPGQIPPLAETILTQFHTILGIVIAFYFGASAYVQTHKRDGAKPRIDA